MDNLRYDIRSRHCKQGEPLWEAINSAVQEAQKKKFLYVLSDIDKMLRLAVPWAPSYIVRAHLTEQHTGPAKFYVAFTQVQGLLKKKWYIIPLARSGDTVLQGVLIALTKPEMKLLASEGWEVLWKAERQRIVKALEDK